MKNNLKSKIIFIIQNILDIKFNNDFISWIEKEIFSKPIQGELF